MKNRLLFTLRQRADGFSKSIEKAIDFQQNQW
jgi:hypothetical protein